MNQATIHYAGVLMIIVTISQIGVRSGNCRRRWKCVENTRSRVSLSRRIDLVGMPAWMKF